MTTAARMSSDKRIDDCWNEPVLLPWHQPVAEHRADVFELCGRHGIDVHTALSVTFDVIDIPLLRFLLTERADDGGLRWGCSHVSATDHHPECGIYTSEVERALVGDLPSWWQPSHAANISPRKHTKDQHKEGPPRLL